MYWTDLGPIYAHGGSANNFPLKGGKSSVLEGGVRVSAFATGGMIPPAMRGTVLGDTTHAIQLADWSAASVCRLHRDTQRDRDRQTVSDRVTAASPPPPWTHPNCVHLRCFVWLYEQVPYILCTSWRKLCAFFCN